MEQSFGKTIRHYSMLRIGIPIIIGMTLSSVCNDGGIEVNTTYLCVALLVLCPVIVRYVGDERYKSPFFGIFITLFCLIFGYTLFNVHYHNTRTAIPQQQTEISGQIISVPEVKPKSIAIKVRNDDATVLAYISSYTCSPQQLASQVHQFDSITIRPRYGFAPCCPIDLHADDLPYKAYRQHLFYNKVSATCYANGKCWSIVHTDNATDIRNIFGRLQTDMVTAYREAGISGDEGAVIESMTTGYRRSMTAEQKAQYSRAGLSHILALSGFHLTVIYTLISMLLLANFSNRHWRKVATGIIIIALWAFDAIAGFPPSLVRASIMCSVMLIGKNFEFQTKALNVAGLAALAMVIYNPMQIMDVGFQLSFISVAGICTTITPIVKFTRRIKHRWMRGIISMICISAVCTIVTAPLVAFHFHQVPLLGIVSTLFVSLLAMILMGASVLWWILVWWADAQAVVSTVMTYVARCMNYIAHAISTQPYSTIHITPTPLEVCLMYFIIISLITYLYKQDARRLICALSGIVALTIIHIILVV